MVVAEALREGFWAGIRVAAVPLVTETFVLALTAAAVLSIPNQALRWVGVVGGVFVLYLGWRTWGRARTADEQIPTSRTKGRSMLEAAILAVVSPTPWLFWFLVGSPLFLAEWRTGWGAAATFLGSFLFMMLAVNAVIAALGGRGRDHLSHRWRRRLLQGTAVVLAGAGALLMWEAWVGDYGRMVTGEEIQGVLDSVMPR